MRDASESSDLSPTPTPSSPVIAGWRIAAARVGCVVLGAVLLVASWAKSLDPAAFAAQVHKEGLDFLLPAAAVAFFALFLEWFLGTALVTGIRHRAVFWLTAALVTFFVFLTGREYWRHLQGIVPEEGASCGCFGNLVERTPAEAFWQDFLLMVPALLLMGLAIDRAGKWPVKRLAVAAFVGVGMTIFAWKAPDLPLDNLATRLKPGIDPFTLCAGSAEDGSRVCLGAILPELETGRHLVVLADVTADDFVAEIPQLNDVAWLDGFPKLWILSSADEEQLFTLRFTHGPTFEIRETPAPLMKPLYRTLPRSFFVVDGRVEETFSGFPPWDAFKP